MKRILYIQYTNPACYPPLEHSSRMLASDGWQVLMLGTYPIGSEILRFQDDPNIAVRCIAFCRPGWRQKVHYLVFTAWIVFRAASWRPQWIYASDVLICPAAYLLSLIPWLRVLYHEHDSPAAPPTGALQRIIRGARRRLAHRAACCVLPNEMRVARFKAETATRRPVLCVWNCPSRQEVTPRRAPGTGNFWLLYQGSLVPARLPLAVVESLAQLPESVKLRVIGYETVGSTGYVGQLVQRANQLGVSSRLEIIGTLRHRSELIEWVRRCDVGLSLMPMNAGDLNERNMTGASNKAFDYLASGLPVVVSDLPDWRAMYVEPGYAIACNPDDAGSIAKSVRRFLDDPQLTLAMGENGRRRVLEQWNYETWFKPVLQRLES